MAEYKLFLKKSVLKDIERIPKRDIRRIIKRIKSLANDPRPLGHEKLTGRERYRIRQGNCRIVYSIRDYELTIWVI